MESTHVIIESVNDGTITPDDAMRTLMPFYVPGDDTVHTALSIEAYMREHKSEEGEFPPELVDFELCADCDRLVIWDDVREVRVHLVYNPACFLGRNERDDAPAAVQA